jgi:hypothetical protein
MPFPFCACLGESARVGDVHAHGLEPVGIGRRPFEHHGDAFGRQDMGFGAEHVGHAAGNVFAAVNGMAQLMQHRAHPVEVGHDVGQHTDITVPIQVRAKRVRTFPRFFVEITARQDVLDRQPDAGIILLADFDDVGLGINAVQIDGRDGRSILEERVMIMPWPQGLDAHPALRRQFGVDDRLGLLKWLAREPVQLIE